MSSKTSVELFIPSIKVSTLTQKLMTFIFKFEKSMWSTIGTYTYKIQEFFIFCSNYKLVTSFAKIEQWITIGILFCDLKNI